MSASLVGSEMCIRDRSSHVWGAAGNDQQMRVLPKEFTPRAWQVAMYTLCLLYTSDAADDM
eukprot:176951-Alexandrium_andersonii.AAC.1